MAPGVVFFKNPFGRRGNPCKTGDPNPRRAGLKQGINASPTGGSTGEHIIHQHNLPARNPSRTARFYCDCPCHHAFAICAPQFAKAGRLAISRQTIQQKLALTKPGHLIRQERRLIKSPVPQSPPVQRHWHQKLRHRIARWVRQACSHQSAHQPGQGQLMPMLQSKHQLARCIIIQGGSNHAGMARWLIAANMALLILRMTICPHGALTAAASRLAGKLQLAPAACAQGALLRDSIAA